MPAASSGGTRLDRRVDDAYRAFMVRLCEEDGMTDAREIAEAVERGVAPVAELRQRLATCRAVQRNRFVAAEIGRAMANPLRAGSADVLAAFGDFLADLDESTTPEALLFTHIRNIGEALGGHVPSGQILDRPLTEVAR